jgi:hypothetical protein
VAGCRAFTACEITPRPRLVTAPNSKIPDPVAARDQVCSAAHRQLSLVPYDIDRAPGEWITREAKRRARIVWLFIILLGAVATVAALQALAPTHTILGGLAIIAAALLLKLLGDPKLDHAVRAKVGAAAAAVKAAGEASHGLTGRELDSLPALRQASNAATVLCR